MAIITGNKREHLRRAKELLVTGQPADLLYAALELRLCLEAMTYEKLRTFAQYLPTSFIEKTWQPPQLLKAMKQFDAMADESFELHMGGIAVPGVPPKDEEFKLVGVHKAFGLKWLTKNYNKVSSLLHLQRSAPAEQEKKWRDDLSSIANEIEAAQRGSILGMCFVDKINFECELCQSQVTVSERFARNQRRAICLNSSCETEYEAKIDGATIFFVPLFYRAPCKACQTEIIVHHRDLRQDLVLACPSCKREHMFRCKWEYGVAQLPGDSQ